MSARERSRPRKRPTQKRSKATVEAIVEATARLLRADGFEAMTMQGVAELAGVSVGSLYQYFATKEALAGAVAEREARSLLNELTSRFSHAAGGEPAGVVRALVGALVDHYRSDPDLHRRLRLEVPMGRECDVLGTDLVVAEQTLLAWLQLRGVAIRSDDAERAIFIAVASVEAVVIQSLLTRPERFEDPALTEELVDLVCRYVLP